jgi:hypothetical protein
MHHHSQFPATPYWATSPQTTRGVSAANVVAIMPAPASHQGTPRPATKSSCSERPAHREKARPTATTTTTK